MCFVRRKYHPVAALALLVAVVAWSNPLWGATVDKRIARGRLGFGFNYPGVGLRYFLLDRYALEARGQFADAVLVTGLRASRYFSPLTQVLPYFGVEVDYVGFTSEYTKGIGYVAEAFVGGEYFVWPKHVSVQFDFGPAWLGLKDRNYDLTVSGIEFIVNFGITYYFSGTGSAPTLLPQVPSRLRRGYDVGL